MLVSPKKVESLRATGISNKNEPQSPQYENIEGCFQPDPFPLRVQRHCLLSAAGPNLPPDATHDRGLGENPGSLPCSRGKKETPGAYNAST